MTKSLNQSIKNYLSEAQKETRLKVGKKVDKNHPQYIAIKDIAHEIESLDVIKSLQLNVKASIGQGRVAAIPWVGIFNEQESASSGTGSYPVFLFSANNDVYLCYILSVGSSKNAPASSVIGDLSRRAEEIRKQITIPHGFSTSSISLGANFKNAEAYEAGALFSKKYSTSNIDTEDIAKDIKAIAEFHINKTTKTILDSKENVTKKTPQMPLEESKIDQILPAFSSDCIDIANLRGTENAHPLLSSLIAKPFIILTGLSGSGKTQSAQAFAQWIGGKASNKTSGGNYALIPVGADWTSNENILGYPDGLNTKRYVSTRALEFIVRAGEDQTQPYFLILDEMNLSHVERYFADILSAIESEEPIPLYEGAARFAARQPDDGKVTATEHAIPAQLELPKNLFIIGTVNVDETTYQFSTKVLDRANVIEFRMTEKEMHRFLENPGKPDLKELTGMGSEFGAAFVQAASSSVTLEAPIKSAFAAEMTHFFEMLKRHNAEFGYRTAHEAARLVHFFRILGDHPADNLHAPDKVFDTTSGELKPVEGQTWFNAAMDTVVIQKLLPKLHGSRSKLENLLIDLALLCACDSSTLAAKLTPAESDKKSGKSPSSLLADLEKDSGAKARYPRSFEKLQRMLSKLRRDQFVSFSEA